jgi:hypothetical protein
VIDTPLTTEEQVAAAAAVLSGPGGGAGIYEVMDLVASAHGSRDAWMVLRPASAGTQVFRRARWTAPPETVAALAARPSGFYSDPPVAAGTSRSLAALCDAALRASLAETLAGDDPSSGLASRRAIDAALTRAAARGARYGWSTTAVLVTTTGDGSDAQRWPALAAALRAALRTGDEAGNRGAGHALALLPHAGPDAVRPFLARVRAALSAAGGDGIDLSAATATTPEESVDPAELLRLTHERLAELTHERLAELGAAAGEGGPDGGAAGDAGALWRLELDLRLLGGVQFVGVSGPDAKGAGLVVTVVAEDATTALQDEVADLVGSQLAGASVNLRASGRPGGPDEQRPQVSRHLAPVPASNGAGSPQETVHHAAPAAEGAAPPPRAASVPGSSWPRGGAQPARVTLVRASFDPDRGLSEVAVALGQARGTGRAPAGPLAGGAQATLTAIAALGVDVPFYLVSAERAHAVSGDPVVVVLAPRQVTAGPQGSAERMGVAGGADDVEAASRATLGALNRYLAKSVADR